MSIMLGVLPPKARTVFVVVSLANVVLALLVAAVTAILS
jgi:hypothetical protein